MLNKEEVIVPQGWKLIYIRNPDYPNRSLEEEIQVAQYFDEEFIEIWYWLIYQGKDPKGYAPPIKRKEIVDHYPEGVDYISHWKPEPNSWRGLNDKEMITVLKYITDGKYSILKDEHTKVKTYAGTEEKLSTDVVIPVSYIFKLPNGWVVKKWRSNEDPEEDELDED